MIHFENLPINQRMLLWLLSGHVGISSRTIFFVLSGVNAEYYMQSPDKWRVIIHWDIPCDFSDFGRCLNLLEYIPEWRERLPEVAEKFPAWKPIVEHWDEIEYYYEKAKNGDRFEKNWNEMLREWR